MRANRSIKDQRELPEAAGAAVHAALEPGESIQLVVQGTFGSALVATDQRILIWKKERLTSFPWLNVAAVVFGGGPLVRWVQARGPSIGLVAPSLLNIGELRDTIQVGPAVDDNLRATMARLVARRAQGLPVEPGAMASLADPPAARSSTEHRDKVLMEAKGAGGDLVLFSDRVLIRHSGFRGFPRNSLPAEREIALARIETVDWRAPGPLRLGLIRFRVLPGPVGVAKEDEPANEMLFYLHQEGAVRALKTAIEHGSQRGKPLGLDDRDGN